MMSDTHDVPGVITYPPLIYAIGFGASIALHMLARVAFLPPDVARIAGAVVVVVSAIPGVWALLAMVKANTSPLPERPTTSLVTDGAFGFSRNPIYLTFTLFYVGVAIFVNNWLFLLPLPVVLWVMQWGVIEREERYLERKFGDQYRAYKARVRRWL